MYAVLVITASNHLSPLNVTGIAQVRVPNHDHMTTLDFPQRVQIQGFQRRVANFQTSGISAEPPQRNFYCHDYHHQHNSNIVTTMIIMNTTITILISE